MSGRLSRLRADLRQRRHHRAFRIAPLPWDEPSREELERLLASVAASAAAVDTGAGPGSGPDGGTGSVTAGESAGSGGSGPSADPAGDSLDTKALSEAAYNLWRAQRRLAQGEGESSRSKHTGRFLDWSRKSLAEAGLVIQDHEGDAFHTGLSLEALAFQEDPTLTAETVTETIKPSIYLHGRRIQMGQVLVGHPPASEPEPEAAASAPAPEDSASAPEPEDSVPVSASAPAPPSAPTPVPAPASEAPSNSDHERTDHA